MCVVLPFRYPVGVIGVTGVMPLVSIELVCLPIPDIDTKPETPGFPCGIRLKQICEIFVNEEFLENSSPFVVLKLFVLPILSKCRSGMYVSLPFLCSCRSCWMYAVLPFRYPAGVIGVTWVISLVSIELVCLPIPDIDTKTEMPGFPCSIRLKQICEIFVNEVFLKKTSLSILLKQPACRFYRNTETECTYLSRCCVLLASIQRGCLPLSDIDPKIILTPKLY